MLLQNVSAPDEEDEDWCRVRHVEQNRTRCHICAECYGRTKIQKPKQNIENIAKKYSSARHVELRVDMREDLVEDNASIAGHGKQQPAGTGNASIGSIYKTNTQHQADDSCCCATIGGLQDHFHNRHLRCCRQDRFRVRYAEENDKRKHKATAAMLAADRMLEGQNR